MKTRLEQCVEALKNSKCAKISSPVGDYENKYKALQNADFNCAIEEAISIITHILGAEPMDGEIEKTAEEIHRSHVNSDIGKNWEECSQSIRWRYRKTAKAALLTQFGGRKV